jgi:hypothetical protein
MTPADNAPACVQIMHIGLVPEPVVIDALHTTVNQGHEPYFTHRMVK